MELGWSWVCLRFNLILESLVIERLPVGPACWGQFSCFNLILESLVIESYNNVNGEDVHGPMFQSHS